MGYNLCEKYSTITISLFFNSFSFKKTNQILCNVLIHDERCKEKDEQAISETTHSKEILKEHLKC